MENVARAPLLLPEVISLAEYRDGVQGRIPVQDLAVTADTDRLYVVSLSRLRTAHAVATHLSDALALPLPPELGDDRSPSSPRWRGQSLSKGAAGVAILHGVRAQGEPGSGDRVHAWLACATARLAVAFARLAAALRPSLSEFDLVRGLTGLGAYLLRRDPHDELVRRVLAYLVQLRLA